MKYRRGIKGKKSIVFSYSMHLPFLLACFILKLLDKNFYWCLIVPDLPEYMAIRVGIAKKIHRFFCWMSYRLADKANCVVLITDAMKSRFHDRQIKIVVEGMATYRHLRNDCEAHKKRKCFLYSGTLSARYGIRSLVEAYVSANINDYELYICGDGTEKEYVKAMACRHVGIKYLGQIDRESVEKLQREATLLINPRPAEGEYTKYSFPSKIIEYMSSGTPALIFKLEGTPNEYYDYCYVSAPGIDNLKNQLIEISKISPKQLAKKGEVAKEFISKYKTAETHVNKILRALIKDCNA